MVMVGNIVFDPCPLIINDPMTVKPLVKTNRVREELQKNAEEPNMSR